MHILLFVTDCQLPFFNQRKNENDHRKYFTINLHKSMGPDRDLTHDPCITMRPGYLLGCGVNAIGRAVATAKRSQHLIYLYIAIQQFWIYLPPQQWALLADSNMSKGRVYWGQIGFSCSVTWFFTCKIYQYN